MGEVYPIGQTCQYMVNRSARQRRAGRFDQSILLLSRAKSQFGFDELLEYEFARTYDEMGCEEEACRHYLRVIIAGKKYKARSLFQLAITCSQHADISRAVSYFEAFLASDREGISAETAELLQRQLLQVIERKPVKSDGQRAALLEQRAVACLHAGKFHAAKRNIERSLRLRKTAQGFALKACCHLIKGEGDRAAVAAQAALSIRPRYVQAHCLYADAYMLNNQQEQARKILIHAAIRAKSTDALMNIAIECAKYGYDKLTLILTGRILKREPYHARALAMRACALYNRGCKSGAKRLFGRLCALFPENSVYAGYFQALEEGRLSEERLSLAQDVTQSLAMDRCMRLLSMINEDPDEIRHNSSYIAEACRLANWAMHSEMAGANVTMIALIVLSVLKIPQTQQVLSDALVDARLDDGLKRSILQVYSAQGEALPEYADLDGRFVRLAAGASMPLIKGAQECQIVVQRAAESLIRAYPNAAKELLALWMAYLKKYGSVKKKRIPACAAALEYAFHQRAGRSVDIRIFSGKAGVSKRLIMFYVRRLKRIGD